MRVRIPIVTALPFFLAMSPVVVAQSLVTTLTLGRDQIGLVKTSPGISTKLSFPEQVKEIICGDLYDPTSGKGNFVIQRSDNDVFLKPLEPNGVSNLFVKTGESGQYTYSFDLLVVPVIQGHRIVNIVNGYPDRRAARKGGSVVSLPMIASIDLSSGFAALPVPVVTGIDTRTKSPAPPAPAKGEPNLRETRQASNPNRPY